MSDIKYFKTWIIYTLISILAAFVAGAIQGSIIGFLLGLIGIHLETISKITSITGIIAGTVISFFIFKWTINKFIVVNLISKNKNRM